MLAILPLVLSTTIPPLQTLEANRPVAFALEVCAQLGMPQETMAAVFGPPDYALSGCLNPFSWRKEGVREGTVWDYARYGVWVQWEKGCSPQTGRGARLRFYGSINP